MMQDTSCKQTHVSPKFDKDFVNEWLPYLRTLITNNLEGMRWTDNSIGQEDLENELLMHLYNACQTYDSTKGMKFSTYAIMHIRDRLKTFRTKMNRNKRRMTVAMSDLNGGWGITGNGEDSKEEHTNHVSSFMHESLQGLGGRTDSVIEMCDIRSLQKKLPPLHNLVFEEIYMKGHTLKEFVEKRPEYSFYKIRGIKRHLEKIYTTLIVLKKPSMK